MTVITEGKSMAHSEGASTNAIVELRRYRLRPQARETLIDLFDREFIETQEAEGMSVIGQFRDLDDPDSFVWLRGFSDMPSRAEALNAFYTGPVWAAHRDQANGTMINSENVLLLRPAAPDTGFAPSRTTRAQPGTADGRAGIVVATCCYLAPRTDEAFATFFETRVKPQLVQASATVLAALVTEQSPNTFPRLPVREGETVFVWFSAFPSLAAYEDHLAALAQSENWTTEVVAEMERRTWRKNEVLRLTPTARSLLP
ncbi:NIPSNAP family protein [Ensifer sp.]|uniref:NIPSNAP family protein n=1 Tax=Ensifer sp. TaxID=1872086 RepID=UPI002E11C6B3|nr:NIPSNAP family protein [Ensifer sp.]